MSRSLSWNLRAIFLVALACNWWLLRSNNILLGISFAVLCLSTSWALASAGQKAQVQERKAPQRYGADLQFAKQKQAPGGEPLNAFTIDLEDYFHTEVSSRSVKYDDWDKMPSRIEYSTHRLLDTLDEHNTQATAMSWDGSPNAIPALSGKSLAAAMRLAVTASGTDWSINSRLRCLPRTRALQSR